MTIEGFTLPSNVFLKVKGHSRLDRRDVVIIELLLITMRS